MVTGRPHAPSWRQGPEPMDGQVSYRRGARHCDETDGQVHHALQQRRAAADQVSGGTRGRQRLHLHRGLQADAREAGDRRHRQPPHGTLHPAGQSWRASPKQVLGFAQCCCVQLDSILILRHPNIILFYVVFSSFHTLPLAIGHVVAVLDVFSLHSIPSIITPCDWAMS